MMSKIESPHINPFGFREYDARWIYPKEINREGIKNVGKGFGSQVILKTNKSPRVIVGHDYRSYSEEVKKNLIKGLIDTGCNIEDIGLALSPTSYFAQFKLNADAVAMVTASHNENGWTGIKMGIEKGLTHSPEEMNELKKILEKNGRDDEETWSSITTNQGSVEHLDFLSDHEKIVFKTAFEIDQKWIIELGADRTTYISQAQSINIFLPADVHKKELHQIHFQAWKKGLKSLYYCRSKSIQRAENINNGLATKIVNSESKEESAYEECLTCQ